MTKNVFLVSGKPGSGKTTASRLAAEKLGSVYHFSIGQEARDRVLGGKQSRHTAKLAPYAEELRQHRSIPPELISLVVAECIEDSPYPTIIADGYPQYRDRIPSFESTLLSAGAEVLAICQINVSDEVAARHLAGRAQRVEGVPEDDAYIRKRLDGYYQEVAPTIEILSKQYPLHVVDGNQSPEAVADGLVAVIDQYLRAA